MKKSLFFIGAVAAMLASCSQEEVSLQTTVDKAIGFNAYSTTSVTRGDVVTVDSFTTTGIGVFAFYQPATNGVEGPKFNTIKYPTPNFMYNQNIKFTATTAPQGTWSYNPVKYWPNNKGDKLSFFAYAPYKAATTWEDLGIVTDARGETLSGTFYINNSVDDQEDYLFADPVVNKAKPTSITNVDPKAAGVAGVDDSSPLSTETYPTTTDVINFNFKHITSKINLFVGVNTDVNTPTTGSTSATSVAEEWTDENTTIEIQSIEFKDMYQTLSWTKEGDAAATWKAEGAQDIKVVPVADSKTISKGWTAGWHRVLACEDTAKPDATGKKDEYMFVAPQMFEADQEIVFTYVVTSGTGDNKSVVTNVITKKWSDFKNLGLTQFKAGLQYKLYFLIGMQSVKISATVTDWEGADVHVLDVPTPNGN